MNTLICTSCQTDKPLIEFHSKINPLKSIPRHICLDCKKKKKNELSAIRRKKYASANPNYWKEQHKKSKETMGEVEYKAAQKRRNDKALADPLHKEKMSEYYQSNKNTFHERNKKWIENNQEKHREWAKKWRKEWYKKQRELFPEKFILRRIHSRIKESINERLLSRSSLFYTGCSSLEELICRLSQKTDNPNWIKHKYHIDHVWQIHWFFDFLKENINNDHLFEKALLAIHHHSNLRPLPSEENVNRSKKDFSPLLLEDYSKFKEFLNRDIINRLDSFFLERLPQ